MGCETRTIICLKLAGRQAGLWQWSGSQYSCLQYRDWNIENNIGRKNR